MDEQIRRLRETRQTRALLHALKQNGVSFLCVPAFGSILWRSGVRLDREASQSMLDALDTLIAEEAITKRRHPLVENDPRQMREALLAAMKEMGWAAS